MKITTYFEHESQPAILLDFIKCILMKLKNLPGQNQPPTATIKLSTSKLYDKSAIKYRISVSEKAAIRGSNIGLAGCRIRAQNRGGMQDTRNIEGGIQDDNILEGLGGAHFNWLDAG